MEGLKKNVKFIHRNSRFREEFARSQGYLLVYAYWGVRGGKLPDKSGSFPQKKKKMES